jgi:hypothetical protein
VVFGLFEVDGLDVGQSCCGDVAEEREKGEVEIYSEKSRVAPAESAKRVDANGIG